ncbi:MarR family winged helix-turn-helix transcriptional regulator [Lysinibacillus sp. Ag94]|uniref:MarR family winged helix-turn-helix transcriptional regulator n=1 Tax=Lysinibacillus sp. Ag94 TaxID=2936682 RepID=UPI00200CE52D|nr:MarR family winged helix-turn-helix transcriptional regulator [Lysinibacillus sp. Ag94]UPW81735.1 MarR family winged helix-turn-helix transcriptional regulator [Lysinibacillus sp. Ag94]
MTKDKELIYMLVEEINEAIYSMDSHFIKLHQNLISDELSPKQIILLDFIKKNCQVTIGQIASYMNITSSAVGQLVSKLEEQQYVCRSINPENRREIFVSLDTSGITYFDREEVVKRFIISRYYSKLELSEVVQLKEIVQKLNQIVLKEGIIHEINDKGEM